MAGRARGGSLIMDVEYWKEGTGKADKGSASQRQGYVSMTSREVGDDHGFHG